MTHRQAVAGMLLVTLLWSIAGVVTRHLEAARSFEITFWRSAFNALALAAGLALLRGAAPWRQIARGGAALWASGLCWAVMYTAFMVALTMTSVANVLVTMSIAPLFAALFARLFLNHRLPARTWVAIAVAGAGIGWMFGHELGHASLAGTAVALLVPLAVAANWVLLQHVHQRSGGEAPDMLPAVLIGALLSAALALPLALPLQASGRDIALLGLLGVVQLAIPCLLSVRLAAVLAAPEMSLLGLLEVIFGVAWAWWLAGEAPGPGALAGGALVIGALVANELVALRGRRAAG